MLDLTSLQDAIKSLRQACHWADKGSGDVPMDILRDSVIQRFEYTYELAWKMIKRRLEINIGSTYVDGVSRKELFRIAAENRLIDDPLVWFAYHDARNRASHVYDESIAQSVFAAAQQFCGNAEKLLAELEKRND